MNKADAEIWKHCMSKKGAKGAYGVTDFKNKKITINKAYHKSKNNHSPGIKKNKDGTASMIDTMVHEEMHKNHPKMSEKTVRKLTSKKVKTMSKKLKAKVYSRYKK